MARAFPLSGNKGIVCVSALLVWLAINRQSLAQPAWYGANGGINPQLPDFYQHQDWVGPNGANGWETNGGWCEYTAYADVFYDMTTRGYTNLFATDPTANPWYAAMYGPTNAAADVKTSDIYKLTKSMQATPFGSVQSYVNATANKTPAVTAGTMQVLVSNNFLTGANGDAFYRNAFGNFIDTGQSVYTFTNTTLKASGDPLYNLNPGTASTAKNANGQGLWWNFHYVAVAGITTNTSTVLIADPDSNNGSNQAAAGWPRANLAFPGALASLPTDPVPTIGNTVNQTDHFAGFTFNGRVVNSTDAPQYKNTIVQSVAAVYPGAVKKVAPRAITRSLSVGRQAATDEETDITLSLPTGSDPVDGIFVEPSEQADNPATDPTVFSFTDDSDPSATWGDSESTTDPFGNALADDGIDYDLTGGNPLEPGETADLNIGTTADFSTEGYDVLLHFQGDPTSTWFPEMIGGTNFDPTDDSSEQAIPEPASAALLMLGCAAVGLRRRRSGNGTN